MDIVCKCGHWQVQHFDRKYGCMSRREDGLWCSCPTAYQPDNLKHIEVLAKERKLV